MPTLKLDGCDLYYEVHGTGPAVVFAHGLGGNHLSWWQQVPAFRDRYTCVTFAHRGFGLSRTGTREPSPARFVDDLAALVDHLGYADVRLVAQSMGGWTCLGYALKHPDRVAKLVMACTIGGLQHPDAERAFAKQREARVEEGLFERGIHPAGGERMAEEQPAMHFLYREVGALNVDLDTPAMRAALYRLRDVPPETVSALRVPVLCITGEEDIVMAPDAVAVLAGLLPNGTLARVPKAGHSVYWERPAEFNRLVAGFLDG